MKRMIDETIKNRLLKIEFFNHCEHAASIPFEVKRVLSWNAATAFFCEEGWEKTTLEASNELSEYLHKNHIEKYRYWNEYAQSGSTFINEDIMEKIKLWKGLKNIDDLFLDCVKWDLLHILLTLQYEAELNSKVSEFYLKLLIVYEAGHFPCGWEGHYPSGKLVII